MESSAIVNPAVSHADGAAPIQDDGSFSQLVIDLDGTLVKTNLLSECALALIKRRPLALFSMMIWLFQGRAVLKRQLALHAQLDMSALPLNPAVESYAAAEKKRGRKVYLATAADASIAHCIADQCGFFDGVLASDGRVNMKGKRKADALEKMFPSGFAYVGDSRADFPVWSRAKEIALVGGSSWTRRVSRRFDKPTLIFVTPSKIRALIRCARPHQWAKNTLVFVPAILSGAIVDPQIVLTTVLSFVALCIVASSTYIVNDLQDLADDRRHWSKRNRPIASGALSISTALSVFPLGLAIGLLLGMMAGPEVTLVLSCYVALTLAYSFSIKRIPLLDVTTLAGLFTLRLVLGTVSAGVLASPWLLVFSMFLFSSLCFAKRYVEVAKSAAKGKSVNSRGYVHEDAPLIFALGTGTGISSVAIMVLYVIFDAFQQTFYGDTVWLWAFPIILFLWVSRIWLVAGRGMLDDDPVAFAVRDTPSLVLGAALLTTFIFAWSGLFG